MLRESQEPEKVGMIYSRDFSSINSHIGRRYDARQNRIWKKLFFYIYEPQFFIHDIDDDKSIPFFLQILNKDIFLLFKYLYKSLLICLKTACETSWSLLGSYFFFGKWKIM